MGTQLLRTLDLLATIALATMLAVLVPIVYAWISGTNVGLQLEKPWLDVVAATIGMVMLTGLVAGILSNVLRMRASSKKGM